MKINRSQTNRRITVSIPYKTTWILILLIVFCTVANGQNLNLQKGVAISGYDPVAYFTLGKAVPGSSNVSHTYKGGVYYFATEDDRKAFIKEPTKYEPQYGGWCAFAMATEGKKVEVNPQTFKIVNGRLLLFYNKFLTNTLISWNKNEKKLLPQADANWTKITK